MIRTSLRAAAVLCLAAGLAPAARADFTTTNVQLLHGWGFQDSLLGYDTGNEQMTTITLNHFTSWKYGDVFAFVDLYRGDFARPDQDYLEANLYAELHPRVFLNRILGTKGTCLGVFRDCGFAFEVNQGYGFYAYLAGVGGDLALPVPGVVSLNAYYRYDSLQLEGPDLRNHTWQASASWSVPFALGKFPFLFAGFVDVSGANDNEDVDVMAQPELLVDVIGASGGRAGKLLFGVEWYLHYNDLIVPDTLVSAPQLLVQWNLN